MKEESGIIEVYHAGTEIVGSPECRRGRKNLDFGQGFYVTDIYDQALNLAKSRSIDRKLPAMINTYLLDRDAILQETKSLIFGRYDDQWLDFIVACRTGKDEWKEYGYIEGGGANDRVINTIILYIQGFISKVLYLRNGH